MGGLDAARQREMAIEGMRGYFATERFSDHTMKVLAFAERIAEGEKVEEGFLRSVVTLGGVYHDIGIPEAMKRHSSMDAPFQEKEGPPIARDLMSKIGVRQDILERVCYIVGAHHTKEKVDGIDFQILWEADFIVNVLEGNLTFSKETLPQAVRDNVRTRAGRDIAAELFRLVP